MKKSVIYIIAFISIFFGGLPHVEAITWTFSETLGVGESFEFHHDSISWTGLDASIWIDWKGAGEVTIEDRIIGNISLDPGQTVATHIESSFRFKDTQSLENTNATETQTADLEWRRRDDEIPKTGSFNISSGATGSKNFAGSLKSDDDQFRLWKTLENVDSFTNSWNYESVITQKNASLLVGSLEDTHLSIFTEELFTYTEEWFTITNVGSSDISFDVEIVKAPVPEPSSLLLSATGLGLIGLAGWRKKRRDLENQS